MCVCTVKPYVALFSKVLTHSLIYSLYIYTYIQLYKLFNVHVTHTHHTQTYQQNFHLVDFNLVIFTIVILSRRLAWCTLQELQAHWNPKSAHGSLNFKRWMVVACTLLVIAWSVVRLVQQTSLFNLLFLFYP